MILNRILLLPLALAASAALSAPLATTVDSPAAARVRGHVEFLADDLLEGRGTGTRGHEIAAAYVATQFRAVGLKPAGDNGGWYQWVPFRRATLVPGKSSIAMTVGGKTAAVSEFDLGLRPSLTDKDRAIDAGLVFVGYGLSDRALGIDDYAGLDTRGKIVVMLRGTPAGYPSDIAAHLGDSKSEIAAAHGAVGMLEIGVGGRVSPTPPGAPRMSLYSKRPSINWVDAAGKSGADQGSLKVSLSATSAMAEHLFTGAPKSLAAVRAEAKKKNVRPRGFPLRPALSIRSESAWEDFKSPEVVALLPGSDPRLKSEYVAMMGHLDHLGLKKDAKPGEDNVYNGALDNAAGVATLLEAARQFADSGKAPRRSILFVAHTGEELGLLGADYFAAHPPVPIGQIVGGVDLDMPVPLYQFNDVVAFGGDHSTIARAVAEAGKAMNISVSPDPMPEQAIFTRSDHYQFVKRGVPAILLFTGYGNGGKAKFDEFFAKNYHQVSDEVKLPILWDAAARYAEFNYRIARQLADAEARPLWYQGNYFGNLFAPGAPRAAN
ncbi:MAG: M20/M25/M40 family metallo-hydrolase [Sphingomonas bacterium]|nr:M20/M25/M40 family metallo-hydrolase [Sphingomonas bacterium]